jgi:hypothetical protein
MEPKGLLPCSEEFEPNPHPILLWVTLILSHHVQTGPRAHPASYTIGNVGSFNGNKVAGVWSWPLTSF